MAAVLHSPSVEQSMTSRGRLTLITLPISCRKVTFRFTFNSSGNRLTATARNPVVITSNSLPFILFVPATDELTGSGLQ